MFFPPPIGPLSPLNPMNPLNPNRLMVVLVLNDGRHVTMSLAEARRAMGAGRGHCIHHEPASTAKARSGGAPASVLGWIGVTVAAMATILVVTLGLSWLL